MSARSPARGDRRDVQHIVRLTPAERDAIHAEAERVGLSLASWSVQALRSAAGLPVFEAPEEGEG